MYPTTKKNWFIATPLKHLRSRQKFEPLRLIVSINRGEHFLLTETVKKCLSKSINQREQIGSININ